MKNISIYIILAFILLTGNRTVAADRQYPDSLLSYLEMAAENNPLVMQKLKEYQASLRKIPQAGTLPDPELSAGIFLMPMKLVSGRQYAEVKLMQMFPWFGVLRNTKDEMSMMANARYEEFRKTKLMVYFEVQSTWYELYKVRREISVTQENIGILNSIEQLALVRFRASPGRWSQSSAGRGAGNQADAGNRSGIGAGTGMDMAAGATGNVGNMAGDKAGAGVDIKANASGSTGNMGNMGGSSGNMGGSSGSGLVDLYRVQIESAELKNKIDLLKNREETIVARFNSYLNRPPRTPVHTIEEALEETPDLPLILMADSIVARNPGLAMIEYEKKAWEARGRMAKGMGYPMTGLGVSYSPVGRSAMSTSEMNGKDMIMPMVSITLPVFRKKQKAMREEAELMQEATALNRQAEVNSLQTAYYEALQAYNDAQRRRELYETQYTLASRSLELIMKSYSAAVADLTDVLRLQQQALGFNLERIRAVADINIAVARLNQLTASDITFQSPNNEKEQTD